MSASARPQPGTLAALPALDSGPLANAEGISQAAQVIARLIQSCTCCRLDKAEVEIVLCKHAQHPILSTGAPLEAAALIMAELKSWLTDNRVKRPDGRFDVRSWRFFVGQADGKSWDKILDAMNAAWTKQQLPADRSGPAEKRDDLRASQQAYVDQLTREGDSLRAELMADPARRKRHEHWHRMFSEHRQGLHTRRVLDCDSCTHAKQHPQPLLHLANIPASLTTADVDWTIKVQGCCA